MERKEKKSAYTLEELMREYGNDVLRMAYLYVKDIHTAEDIFQEVFLKVNQKLDTLQLSEQNTNSTDTKTNNWDLMKPQNLCLAKDTNIYSL